MSFGKTTSRFTRIFLQATPCPQNPKQSISSGPFYPILTPSRKHLSTPRSERGARSFSIDSYTRVRVRAVEHCDHIRSHLESWWRAELVANLFHLLRDVADVAKGHACLRRAASVCHARLGISHTAMFNGGIGLLCSQFSRTEFGAQKLGEHGGVLHNKTALRRHFLQACRNRPVELLASCRPQHGRRRIIA